MISFIVVGHSFSSGIYSQLLVIVHIICISYWVGSFLPLRHMCTINNCKNLHEVAHNFGVYAVLYISLLVITGLIFSYILLGGVSPLITSYYGNVLLIKILLVSIILAIGAINKFKIVPNIKVNQLDGQNKLKSSIEIEIILTFFVLLLGVKYFGLTSSGSQRWLNFYFMNLQPSELMKIGLIIFLAKYYHRISTQDVNRIKFLFLPIVALVAPVLLVVAQPDLGTSILIALGGVTVSLSLIHI